nr:MAG TPA: hypothetical protein [Caudoviricetes sp.]
MSCIIFEKASLSNINYHLNNIIIHLLKKINKKS